MSVMRSVRTRWLAGLSVACLALVFAAADAPAIAGPAVEGSGSRTLSVSVNIPLSGVAHGQFCQAYANVYGGSGTYTTFAWSGQFEGSGQSGPQGPGQIINGYLDSSRPHWLRVEVTDSNNATAWDEVELQFTGEFNDECAA